MQLEYLRSEDILAIFDDGLEKKVILQGLIALRRAVRNGEQQVQGSRMARLSKRRSLNQLIKETRATVCELPTDMPLVLIGHGDLELAQAGLLELLEDEDIALRSQNQDLAVPTSPEQRDDQHYLGSGFIATARTLEVGLAERELPSAWSPTLQKIA